MALDVSRRSLITGLVAFVAAPAIVRAANLMPVKVMAEPEVFVLFREYWEGRVRWMMSGGVIFRFENGEIAEISSEQVYRQFEPVTEGY